MTEEESIGETTLEIIRMTRKTGKRFPDNTYPIMYALAFLMVENGATSKQNLDGATRSIKQFMDRIQKEQNKNQNRASRNNNRE